MRPPKTAAKAAAECSTSKTRLLRRNASSTTCRTRLWLGVAQILTSRLPAWIIPRIWPSTTRRQMLRFRYHKNF